MAIKDIDRALTVMGTIKHTIEDKPDRTLYLQETEKQLSSIPDPFTDTIIQLCNKYGPGDVTELINSVVDAFYADSETFPETARTLNKTLLPLLTRIINTLLQDEIYLRHVVAIVASLTENKSVQHAFAVDEIQGIENITFLVELFLFQVHPARRITIRPGNSKMGKFFILIEKSH